MKGNGPKHGFSLAMTLGDTDLKYLKVQNLN